MWDPAADEPIKNRIAAAKWKDASTYKDAPHSYILRSWDPILFAHFEQKLKTEAVREPFTLRGKTYTYSYYYPGDGYRYWIIQQVLNRCLVQPDPERPGQFRPVGPDLPGQS